MTLHSYNFNYETASYKNCAMQIQASCLEEAVSLLHSRVDDAKVNSIETLEDSCLGCEEEDCQDCCPHEEHDHFICLQCGHEGEPSDYYDEDYGSDR